MRAYFKDKQYRNPKLSYYILTEEGVDAVNEAIDYLENKAFCKSPLDRCPDLDKSAQDLINHMGPNGYNVPQSLEFEMDKRIKKHSDQIGSMSENVSFGWKTGKDIILQMLIDDGVPNRGHRLNLFGKFAKVGIAAGEHKVYKHFAVLDFIGQPN